MKCDFCGHEVAPGTVECPYCHYQFKIDAQVLSPEERDTFEGVTIDESAGTEENKSAREGAVYDSGADAYNERQRNEPRCFARKAARGAEAGREQLRRICAGKKVPRNRYDIAGRMP